MFPILAISISLRTDLSTNGALKNIKLSLILNLSYPIALGLTASEHFIQ